jgi:hypothetical protein
MMRCAWCGQPGDAPRDLDDGTQVLDLVPVVDVEGETVLVHFACAASLLLDGLATPP